LLLWIIYGQYKDDFYYVKDKNSIWQFFLENIRKIERWKWNIESRSSFALLFSYHVIWIGYKNFIYADLPKGHKKRALIYYFDNWLYMFRVYLWHFSSHFWIKINYRPRYFYTFFTYFFGHKTNLLSVIDLQIYTIFRMYLHYCILMLIITNN